MKSKHATLSIIAGAALVISSALFFAQTANAVGPGPAPDRVTYYKNLDSAGNVVGETVWRCDGSVLLLWGRMTLNIEEKRTGRQCY